MMILIKKPTLQKRHAEFGKKSRPYPVGYGLLYALYGNNLKNTVGYFMLY